MENETMPYRQALPYLLKQRDWSYRELDWRTRKSASYWNQTVTGKQKVPQRAAAYELLADAFAIRPEFFREYRQIKAAEIVLNDPDLAYMVVKEADKREKKKNDPSD